MTEGAAGSVGRHAGCGTDRVGAVVGTHVASAPTVGATWGSP